MKGINSNQTNITMVLGTKLSQSLREGKAKRHTVGKIGVLNCILHVQNPWLRFMELLTYMHLLATI